MVNGVAGVRTVFGLPTESLRNHLPTYSNPSEPLGIPFRVITYTKLFPDYFPINTVYSEFLLMSLFYGLIRLLLSRHLPLHVNRLLTRLTLRLTAGVPSVAPSRNSLRITPRSSPHTAYPVIAITLRCSIRQGYG